jgi:hypothetical protein
MLSEIPPKSLLNRPEPRTPTTIGWESNSSLNAMISSSGFPSLRWAYATVAPLSSILFRQLSTCRMSRPHLPSVVSVGLTDAPIIEDTDNRSQGVDQRYPLVVD